MTYTTAAKIDTPTNWKALWISFGDGTFSKKNDSQVGTTRHYAQYFL